MVSLFKKRVLAYIADYFVVTAIMWIIAQLLAIIVLPYEAFFIYDYFIIILPFVGLIYFVVLEAKMGATVGKHLLFLKVVSNDNKDLSSVDNEVNYSDISYKQSLIRNLSKIYWFPIIIDWLIGRLVGQSNERILGRVSKTEVIKEEIEEWFEEKSKKEAKELVEEVSKEDS